VDERYEIADLVVNREEGITATFADGHVATFELTKLRLGCPCATCRNLRDHGEEAWPRPGDATPLRVSEAKLHGGWGLNITWNDGHSTGIYPFESLRRWSEGQPPFGADSGFSGA
jgi:prepilin-type processing-associated H-X9-DG protein